MDKVDLVNNREVVKVNSYDRIPYGQTDIGRVRQNNEDALLLFDPEINGTNRKGLHKVFAVADGVGGRSAGEVASRSIVVGVYEFAKAGEYIGNNELHFINRRIIQGASTLVLAQQLEGANDYLVYSVGDSSPILIDTSRDIVTELTRRDENPDGKVNQVMGPVRVAKLPLLEKQTVL